MLISENIRKYCTFNGLRHSGGREIVTDKLQKMNNAVVCEEIWLTLRSEGQKISESGVYIHLRWPEENGFVEERKGKERQATFLLRSSESVRYLQEVSCTKKWVKQLNCQELEGLEFDHDPQRPLHQNSLPIFDPVVGGKFELLALDKTTPAIIMKR